MHRFGHTKENICDRAFICQRTIKLARYLAELADILIGKSFKAEIIYAFVNILSNLRKEVFQRLEGIEKRIGSYRKIVVNIIFFTAYLIACKSAESKIRNTVYKPER